MVLVLIGAIVGPFASPHPAIAQVPIPDGSAPPLSTNVVFLPIVVQSKPAGQSGVAPATPTPYPSATPTPVPPNPNVFGPRVNINANLFTSLDRSKIQRGDMFKSQAVRYGTPEAPLNRMQFLRAIRDLDSISPSDTKRYGITKTVVFSSIQDLQTYIADPLFPIDTTAIDYDFESVMTPASELADPLGSVSRFAAIAKGNGRRVGFIPEAGMLQSLQAHGQLDSILRVVDSIVYQGQNQLPSLGEQAFLATVQRTYAHTHNSGAHLEVQLWAAINGCNTMVQVFNASVNWLDVVDIGTHDDGPSAECVLSGLRP